MVFERCSEGDIEVISLAGDLNAAIANRARDDIQGLIDSGRSNLVLDLEGVRLVDSSGLSVLVAALKAARAAGGDVVLASLKPEVEKIVVLTRLNKVLSLFPDKDTAIASLKN